MCGAWRALPPPRPPPAARGAAQVEGRVLRVEGDGPLAEWGRGGRPGAMGGRKSITAGGQRSITTPPTAGWLQHDGEPRTRSCRKPPSARYVEAGWALILAQEVGPWAF